MRHLKARLPQMRGARNAGKSRLIGQSPSALLTAPHSSEFWVPSSGLVTLQVASGETPALSAINFAAVAYAVDAHEASLVRNLVNHTVVTDTDAPVVFAARQFSATGRTRVRGQCSDCRNHAVVNLRREPVEVFLCTAFKQD